MDPDNMPTGIIFNNTSSPQTADLEFKNGGYYTVGGLQRVIAPGTSGVDALSSDAFRVYAQGGVIYAVSDCPCIVQVVSVDGRNFSRTVSAGVTCLGSFSRGIYIVNGKKVAVM